MVVLAASITSKRSGKVLVSRQFVGMPRIRIEGLLDAFHKLIDSKKQYTYVETKSVCYVYQPIENLYMLLVTNKQSNILDDLDTLRFLSKVVSKYCTSLDEEDICKNAFELVFAFGEVISLGHKENVTIADVGQYCEMESEEEKLHKLEQQRKIDEARELMKSKASEIDKHKEKLFKRGSSSLQSMGLSSVSDSSPSSDIVESSYEIVESSYDIGRDSRFGSIYDILESSSSNSQGNPSVVSAPSIGMTLGNSQRANRFVESCIEK